MSAFLLVRQARRLFIFVEVQYGIMASKKVANYPSLITKHILACWALFYFYNSLNQIFLKLTASP